MYKDYSDNFGGQVPVSSYELLFLSNKNSER